MILQYHQELNIEVYLPSNGRTRVVNGGICVVLIGSEMLYLVRLYTPRYFLVLQLDLVSEVDP